LLCTLTLDNDSIYGRSFIGKRYPSRPGLYRRWVRRFP